MKKTLFVCIWIFCGIGQLPAQDSRSSLLWEISGNGLSEPSYLFGTFHIMCKQDFRISDTLENKIKGVKQFFGELKLDDPALQTKLMSKLIMNGQTLQSMIPESEYPLISKKFQEITGMPLIMLNNFKPFMSLSLLALNSISCKETVQPETEFVKMAEKYEIPVMGLETVDDQLNAIDKEPIDSQILSLKKTVLNFDSVKHVMTEMIAVYQQRNIDSLFRYMQLSGMSDDFETVLLDKRNQNWIPIMEAAIRKGAAFFAVGAGHLGGQEGVIHLLRTKGYQLKPVMY
jgi:uncharacterized protein YbaP (TraB family)